MTKIAINLRVFALLAICSLAFSIIVYSLWSEVSTESQIMQNRQVPILPIRTDLITAISDNRIEASGIAWDQIINAYWLVSDDNREIFLLNSDGHLLEQLEIESLKVDDLESISLNKGHLYLAASSSYSKSGERGSIRQKFVRLSRHQKRWRIDQEIDLVQFLSSLSQSNKTSDEARLFLQQALDPFSKSIDIEAHQIVGNTLFLGFKSPLSSQNKTVIIAIDGVDSFFENTASTAYIWKEVELNDQKTNKPMRLTDMDFHGRKLYLTSVKPKSRKPRSALWELDLESDRLSLLTTYEGYKAEGVAVNEAENQLMIVFDMGDDHPSYFTTYYIGGE